MNLRLLPPLVALALHAGCSVLPTTSVHPERQGAATQLEVPLEALNPDVREDTIQQTICVPGYAASVRPASSYTNGVKAKLLRDRGLPALSAADYELDHRVPLALGGHPRSLVNLELQPWDGESGAKKKDHLERKLQRLVCSGKLRLKAARRAVYFDWRSATRTFTAEP